MQDPIVMAPIPTAIATHISVKQTNNKNGSEKGNSGIETIARQTKANTAKMEITNPIRMNHEANRSMAIWNIHGPKHGINANHDEAITHINKIINPITPITTSTIIAEYINATPRRLAIQLIIPTTIHNPHTKNPTHGIIARQRANPRRHPKPKITIGIVSRGTMQTIRQIKMRLKIREMTFVIMKMQMAKRRAHVAKIETSITNIKSYTSPQIGNNNMIGIHIKTVMIAPNIKAYRPENIPHMNGNAPAINTRNIMSKQ